MDYIEWCERVLACLAEESERNSYVRDHGIDTSRLEKLIWGEHYEEVKASSTERRFHDVVDNAIYDLEEIGLVTDDGGYRYKLTLDGKRVARDSTALYSVVCSSRLPEPELSTLRIIGDLTAMISDDYATVIEEKDSYAIYRELIASDQQHSTLSESEVDQAIKTLRSRGLLFCESGTYPGDIRINYRGMIWLHKREEVAVFAEIDELVREWETTNVDFKRELRLDTASEKAEFIKDVIGLANTKTSGRRCLIVGFDDATRSLYFPPEPVAEPWHTKICQDRMEQLISHYVRPSINIRYTVLEYRGGTVGKLEILRDARDLPYSVRQSVGDRSAGRRIEKDDVFVRHGSQTVKPDDKELQDLISEGQRAKEEAS